MIKHSGKIGLTAVILAITSLINDPGKLSSEALKSGYHFSRPDTLAIQDDKFGNPGMIYVDRGSRLWHVIEGEHSRSCADCHGDAFKSMAGVGNTYPKFNAKTDKLINLGQQIQLCRTENMGASPFQAHEHEHESEDLLALQAYVMFQSRGMPLTVSVIGTSTSLPTISPDASS